MGLFWLTIVWALGYGLWYHVVADRSQVKRLADEMAAAEAALAAAPAGAEATAAASAVFAVTPESVSAGEKVFAQNCAACHGANLQGGIGPTFLDTEWLHGGQATDIIRTITQGVPAKGMIAWGPILSPEQINQVAAYVVSRHSEATGRPVEEIVGSAGQPESTGDPGAAASADSGAPGTP